MTALPNKHYSEHCKAKEHGEKIWRKHVDNRFQVQLEEDGTDTGSRW